MTAGRAVLITSGIFTDQARTWAEEKPFDLVDGKMLLRLISKANGSYSTLIRNITYNFTFGSDYETNWMPVWSGNFSDCDIEIDQLTDNG